MDKKYIEENEIEIKYLRGRLTDKELEDFEVYLMENPEAIEQVEIARLLQKSEVYQEKTDSFWSNTRTSLRGIVWLRSKTAIFFLATCIGGVLVFQGSPRESTLYLANTRGNSSNIAVAKLDERKISIFDQMLNIRVQLESLESKQYLGQIFREVDGQQAKLVEEYQNLDSNEYGEVSMNVVMSKLGKGSYFLELKKLSDPTITDQRDMKFRFKIE